MTLTKLLRRLVVDDEDVTSGVTRSEGPEFRQACQSSQLLEQGVEVLQCSSVSRKPASRGFTRWGPGSSSTVFPSW